MRNSEHKGGGNFGFKKCILKAFSVTSALVLSNLTMDHIYSVIRITEKNILNKNEYFSKELGVDLIETD